MINIVVICKSLAKISTNTANIEFQEKQNEDAQTKTRNNRNYANQDIQ